MVALAQGDSLPLQRIKVGSVLVREYEGKLHEAYVVPDGFSWQGKTYASLSSGNLYQVGNNNYSFLYQLRSIEGSLQHPVPAHPAMVHCDTHP
jgi:hypothetical protein